MTPAPAPTSAPTPLPPALRVVLFTDTLADVNGVSRFILDASRLCAARARDLIVVTSTRFPCPHSPGRIINLPPRAARAMPGYPNLEIVTPPIRRAAQLLRDLRPHLVHVSTPGPVGFAGRRAALHAGIPLLGVCHTDFPAYVRHLFDDDALAWCAAAAITRFYAPFATVLTRSASAAKDLLNLGFPCRRLRTLRPGTDTLAFHPRHRDPAVWSRLRLDPPHHEPDPVRFLVTSRVSVEKNLPFLARVWARADRLLHSRGLHARLIVVGDGPYLPDMASLLASTRATFAGFRRGSDLAAIYASSDVFLFPSRTDTLGQVVMEAQASGLPTIVSDRGGPREIILHNRTGLVLSGTDESAWIDAILALAADHSRRRAMASAAAAWMATHSIEASIDHFWAIHQHAAAHPAPRPSPDPPCPAHPSA